MNAAKIMDGVVNRWFLDPVIKGSYPEDILEMYRSELNSPDIRDGDMRKIASNDIDFLGVNYYTRMIVKYSEKDPLLGYEQVSPEGAEYTGIGWEIYPTGLYEILSRVHCEYGQPEIYITENGAAFDDSSVSGAYDGDGCIHDIERVKYLERHLIEVDRAIKEGIKIKGYYLWSLMDNFEWDYGYSQRFGIIYIDFKTLERRWKSSAYWYRDVIYRNGFEYGYVN
jgi:beta-glucosidase